MLVALGLHYTYAYSANPCNYKFNERNMLNLHYTHSVA